VRFSINVSLRKLASDRLDRPPLDVLISEINDSFVRLLFCSFFRRKRSKENSLLERERERERERAEVGWGGGGFKVKFQKCSRGFREFSLGTLEGSFSDFQIQDFPNFIPRYFKEL